MAPQINTKDIPEKAVRLIGPRDQVHRNLAAAFRPVRSNPIIERLKPFSVFLKNIGSRNIVAYTVKWEMVKSDGTVLTRDEGGINFSALTGDGFTHFGFAVPHNGIRLITPFTSLGEAAGSDGLFSYSGGTDDPSRMAEIQQAAQNMDSFLDLVVSELRSYVELRASVDGIVFDDGEFVGPDTTQLFDGVTASVDAKRDLLNEVKFKRDRTRPASEIFDDVTEVANSQLAAGFHSQADYYNFYKKNFAAELLRMRQAMGDERAISEALRPLGKNWVRLRKE